VFLPYYTLSVPIERRSSPFFSLPGLPENTQNRLILNYLTISVSHGILLKMTIKNRKEKLTMQKPIIILCVGWEEALLKAHKTETGQNVWSGLYTSPLRRSVKTGIKDIYKPIREGKAIIRRKTNRSAPKRKNI
jgi:hypothetical protein